MKTINKKYLKSLKPCEDRWRNYLTHYSDFEGEIIDFLTLNELSVEDKMWVCLRLETLPLNVIQEFGFRCAEKVLSNFESKFPDDNRPREAIQIARKVVQKLLPESDVSRAASIAWSAEMRSAWSASGAARSAAESVWSAVWSASQDSQRSIEWSVRSAACAARSAAESDPRIHLLASTILDFEAL